MSEPIPNSTIRDRKKAAQLLDFADLKWRSCRPTDIDLSVDFKGRAFMFVELKRVGQELTIGQLLHLEGLCKAIAAGGREAIAIFAIHDVWDPEQDVHCAYAEAYSYFDVNENSWVKIDEGVKLKSFMDRWYYSLPEEVKK